MKSYREAGRRFHLLTLAALTCWLAHPPAAVSQALPTAEASPISTGFSLPHAPGTLSYGVSASESLTSGFYSDSGIYSSTNLNGDLAFITNSKNRPFSMVLSGGRSWANSGQASTNYANLALSQVINTRVWNFIISDAVNYLPETPTAGLSGIPGVGDVGIAPIGIGTDAVQGVLTGYSARINNTTNASASRRLTGKTSAQLSGSYTFTSFLGDSEGGIDSHGTTGSLGGSHMIDPRNSLNVSYVYSDYSFGQTGGVSEPDVVSQSANVGYSHQFTRMLSGSVSAGPQWTRFPSSVVGNQTTTSTNLSVNVIGSYSARFGSASLAYSRGTNAGFGVVSGARSDSLSFFASHTFARVWSAGFSAAYNHTTSLESIYTGAFSSQAVVFSAQVSRAIARNLSAYASYTLEDQSSPDSSGVDAFNGFFQVASFGLTYSPGPIHFGPR